MQKLSTAVSAVLLLSASQVYADARCETVKMADPGWSDIAATNAITGFLLSGMGYKAKVDTLAVPITFGGLKDGQVDVFMGNWMPAQQGFYDKFVANGDVVQLAKNLEGTEFTLAVPDYVWEAGVRDFADLNKFADKFDKKIYGIGSGAPANLSLHEIIKKNDFDLGQWKLIESSEQAMLAEVSRAVKRERFVTFLGWTPNLTFTQDMENSIMAEVANNKVSNADAAKAWIKANPAVLEQWLEGVKTLDGQEALAAVKARL
jgi:glycine betaine/proline transport system substrate-binding protein